MSEKTRLEFPADDIIQFLKATPTPYISDALLLNGIQNTQMWGILPLVFGDPHRHIAGPALTMRFIRTYSTQSARECPYKDVQFIDDAPRGSVIVREGSGMVGVGARCCGTAVRAGVEAIISDGPVRDTDRIIALNFPVFVPGGRGALGVKMQDYATIPMECVGYNMPIWCGIPGRPGALVRPGDMVVGDNDGVVVVPAKFLDVVVKSIKEIVELEEGKNGIQAMIDKGKPWEEIYPTIPSWATWTGSQKPVRKPVAKTMRRRNSGVG